LRWRESAGGSRQATSALDSAAFSAGRRTFRVTGVQAAGMIPHTLAAADTCIEIMTGAALPSGADCVVPYEETSRDGDTITLSPSARLASGAALHLRGSDAVAGTVLVPAGTRLTGREIAVAASVGAAVVGVAMRPGIAILATGDELVEIDCATLAPHHVRKSNDYALRAALLSSGLVARAERFHLRDLPHEIETTLRHVVAGFDVVILTGGVSKGKFDHIPAALANSASPRKSTASPNAPANRSGSASPRAPPPSSPCRATPCPPTPACTATCSPRSPAWPVSPPPRLITSRSPPP